MDRKSKFNPPSLDLEIIGAKEVLSVLDSMAEKAKEVNAELEAAYQKLYELQKLKDKLSDKPVSLTYSS